MSDKKILIGVGEIMEFIGISKKDGFYEFIKMGMPARQIKGRWYAHSENIEAFFQKLTFFKEKNPTPETDL